MPSGLPSKSEVADPSVHAKATSPAPELRPPALFWGPPAPDPRILRDVRSHHPSEGWMTQAFVPKNVPYEHKL